MDKWLFPSGIPSILNIPLSSVIPPVIISPFKFHKRAVLSSDVDKIVFPSGEKQTE